MNCALRVHAKHCSSGQAASEPASQAGFCVMLVLLVMHGCAMGRCVAAAAGRLPVAALNRQTMVSVAAEGTKPASWVTAGSACGQQARC